jgi:NADH dehydrogenase
VALSGPAAVAVTRAYHLLAVPGNRLRIVADWALDALLPRHTVQLGVFRATAVPLEVREAGRAA